MHAEGSTTADFAPVRAAFEAVLDEHEAAGATGAAVAVHHRGEWVVDLWGGSADVAGTRPWGEDTVVMPYSVTKPFAAVCALVLVDRGVLDLDAPLTTYWPEMVAATTLRQVLSHQSGHALLEKPAPAEALLDWDRMCALVAAQPPLWEPGHGCGESALLYGHLVGEVVRRVDGRSLGTFLREEVCGPHGLDFHVGLREAELAAGRRPHRPRRPVVRRAGSASWSAAARQPARCPGPRRRELHGLAASPRCRRSTGTAPLARWPGCSWRSPRAGCSPSRSRGRWRGRR